MSVEEELNRILPVLENLPKNEFVISLDTTKPEVAKAGQYPALNSACLNLGEAPRSIRGIPHDYG